MSAIHVSGLRKVYSKPLAGRVISRIDSWFRLASRLALRLPREEVVALDGIDLNIKQGEFFVLAGATTFVFLVGGPTFLWLGMRKLNRKKDYPNSPVNIIP